MYCRPLYASDNSTGQPLGVVFLAEIIYFPQPAGLSKLKDSCLAVG